MYCFVALTEAALLPLIHHSFADLKSFLAWASKHHDVIAVSLTGVTYVQDMPCPTIDLTVSDEEDAAESDPVQMPGRLKEWACKFCTLLNSAEQARCTACDQWQYAHLRA